MTTLIFVKLIYSCITSAVFASNPVMIRVKTKKKTEMERSIKARNLSFYTSSSCSMYSYGINNLKIKPPELAKKKKSKCCPYNLIEVSEEKTFSYISQSEIALFPKIGMK